MDRVGAKVPARFLSIGEEDPFSDIVEITHTETNPLQYFCFVIASFYKAI